MRWARLFLFGLWIGGGCARHSTDEWPQSAKPNAPSAAPPVIVTPSHSRFGRITAVNPNARYVVITYSVGIPLPPVDRRLNVYRAGLKVAEVKVSKEQVDVNAVADILTGDCQVGDEARED